MITVTWRTPRDPYVRLTVSHAQLLTLREGIALLGGRIISEVPAS